MYNGLIEILKMNDKLKEINDSISNSIRRDDEKASSLFTATGIIFGLSSFLISFFATKTNYIQLVVIYIFSALYLAAFLFLVVVFSLTIFPRKKPKKDREKYVPYKYYSEDVFSKVGCDDFSSFLLDECPKETIINQIEINSRIAHKKEKLIVISVYGTIFFSLMLVALVILVII